MNFVTIKPGVVYHYKEIVTKMVTIKERCKDGRGLYFCTTHNRPLKNHPAGDSHCKKGSHVVVFICGDHGAETI